MKINVDPQQTRRVAIGRILREQRVSRQDQLVKILREQGFEATQSSVSRDLRELGVAKAGDRYIIPSAREAFTPDAFATVADFVHSIHTAGGNLTVLKTAVGAAQSVALPIDRADWPEVVGTVAGDDTIFIATRDKIAQSKLIKRLESVFGLKDKAE